MAGKSLATMTAAGLVSRAAAAYLGLATKVISAGPACSMPLRPLISVSGFPFSKCACRMDAIWDSFMGDGEERINPTPVSQSSSGWCLLCCNEVLPHQDQNQNQRQGQRQRTGVSVPHELGQCQHRIPVKE